MKFKTIDGQIISVEVKKSECKSFKSKLEEEVYGIISQRFQYDSIVYEFHIPGMSRMSLDFYIPERKLAIECDGIQHKQYNPFFHKNLRDFMEQKRRDSDKDLFCEMNNITLIRVQNIKELQDYV